MEVSEQESYEQFIDLAVDVFKTKNLGSITALKNFLNVLPSPVWIEQVLALAVQKLAETDPDTCCWLLERPNYLMPELDLRELAIALVCSKLQDPGLIPDGDFGLDINRQLYLSQQAQSNLWKNCSAGDRLLVQQMLKLQD